MANGPAVDSRTFVLEAMASREGLSKASPTRMSIDEASASMEASSDLRVSWRTSEAKRGGGGGSELGEPGASASVQTESGL